MNYKDESKLSDEDIQWLTEKFARSWVHKKDGYVFATRTADEMIEYFLEPSVEEAVDIIYYVLLLRRELGTTHLEKRTADSFENMREPRFFLKIAHDLSSFSNKYFIRDIHPFGLSVEYKANAILLFMTRNLTREKIWDTFMKKMKERYSFTERSNMGLTEGEDA